MKNSLLGRTGLCILIFASVALLLVAPAARAGEPLPAVPQQIRGVVFMPDGKPAADAPVIVFWHKPLAKTRTDTKGNFSMDLDTERMDTAVGGDWPRMAIASALPGYGPGWETFGRLKKDEPVQLKLVEDQPIHGHILDQQGQAVVGATVTIQSMHRSSKENLDGFLRTSRDSPTQLWLHERDKMLYLSPEALLKLLGQKNMRRPEAKTDADGKFSLSGFGRERSLFVSVSGPGITRENVYVVTRPELDARWKRGQPTRETLIQLESGASMPSVYPAKFHHLASPAAVIRGTLTDAKTGHPVEGMNVHATIRGSGSTTMSVSDSQGRYEITGLPLDGKLQLSVLNPGGQPYLDARVIREISATRPVASIDLRLDRGVRVSGRAVDRQTGKPIIAGGAGYLSWPNNPQLQSLEHAYGTNNTMATDQDGHFSIVVPPGPGVLTFQARDLNRFDSATAKDFGFPVSRNGAYEVFGSGNRGFVTADGFHFLQRIEPSEDQTELQVDIALGRGPTIPVRVTAEDGSLLGQLDARGLRRGRAVLRSGQFDIMGLRPNEKRIIFLRDKQHARAGVFEFVMPGSGEPKEVTLRLERSCTISGRLADASARPLTGWLVGAVSPGAVAAMKSPEKGQAEGMTRPFEFSMTQTDADGYFHLKGLPPTTDIEIVGMKIDRSARPEPVAIQTLSLRPGQRLDLGQIQMK